MFAVAAFFCAEHRGFGGGNLVEDWLAAEAEIDSMPNSSEGTKFTDDGRKIAFTRQEEKNEW